MFKKFIRTCLFTIIAFVGVGAFAPSASALPITDPNLLNVTQTTLGNGDIEFTISGTIDHIEPLVNADGTLVSVIYRINDSVCIFTDELYTAGSDPDVISASGIYPTGRSIQFSCTKVITPDVCADRSYNFNLQAFVGREVDLPDGGTTYNSTQYFNSGKFVTVSASDPDDPSCTACQLGCTNPSVFLSLTGDIECVATTSTQLVMNPTANCPGNC